MKDGIIKGTGDSRYLKSALNGINTWEDFKAALLAGTLPIDLNGINEAGWQQIGTALNKANLLDDVTCDLLGIPHEAVPNAAFLALAIGSGKYGFAITVKTTGGNPLSGVTITGVTKPNGSTAVTDSKGYVLAVATSKTPIIAINSIYNDVSNKSQSLSSSGTITNVTITMPRNGTTSAHFTISQVYKFSPDVKTIMGTCVGGGGGGGGGLRCIDDDEGITHIFASGGGGGSGYVSSGQIALQNGGNISISIGVGGSGGGNYQYRESYSYGEPQRQAGTGNNGGTTIISSSNLSISASGGSGGTGGMITAKMASRAGGTGGIGNSKGDNGTTRGSNGDNPYDTDIIISGGSGGAGTNGYGGGGNGGYGVIPAISSSNTYATNGGAGTSGYASISWAF